MQSEQYRVIPRIIVYGGPGCGKTTLCGKIAETFNVVHVSTGAILRNAIAEGTALGKEAKMYANRGELVPDEEMIEVILERLQQEDCVIRGWVLDGYPRTKPQAEALVKAGYICGVFINLDLPKELMRDRVLNRRTDPETGQIYNLVTYLPPTDEGLLERLTERHDDNEKAFANQLDAFDENFESVTKFYENYLLRIDSNRTADVVWDELNYRLHKIFKYEIIFSFGDNSTLTASTLADNYAYTYLHMDTLLAQQGPIISVNTSVDIIDTAAVIADDTKATDEKSKQTDINDVNANKEETREGGSNEDSVDIGEDTGNKGQDEEKKKLPATEYGSKITSEVMVSVLEEAMKKSNFTKFIIEGFPRNEENLKYNHREYTYNSRLAQELGYWGQTKYDNEKIHDELYKSYFINKKNVYEIDVLLNAASKAKLPQEEAKEILEKRTYKDVIDKHWEYSYKLGVTGVPTYILDKSYLVGAQQEDNFHQLFEKENIERL